MMKGFMNPLVKSGPANLNRQDECNAAASIEKARMVSAFAIVKKNLKISCLLIIGAIN